MANSTRNGSGVAAVAYYRMSSDKQEASIPEQRHAVEQYAAEHGFKLIGEYADAGISGDATAKRLEFQRMIADADGGKFKAVLVWDADRFGRFDSIEAGRWIHPLREAGVKLVTLTDGAIDWSDFAGRVMFGIKQEGKHQFLRDLSRNVLRGKLAAAKRGEWMSQAPFGYRVENKRLTPGDAAEVELVRSIFAWYLGGESVRGIMRRLNEQGVPSSTGAAWTPAAIQRVLKNVAYIGTFRWNAKHGGKYHRVTDGRIEQRCGGGEASSDKSDWIVIAGHHPAIIDRKMFDAVQERSTARKRSTTPHADGGRFALTGLIRCGKCGGRMFGKDPHRKCVSYVCSTEHQTGRCDRNTIKQDELLRHIVDAIAERFAASDIEQRLRDELHKQVKSSTSKASTASVSKQLASIEAKLAKAKRRLLEVDSDMVAIVSEHIRELTEQRDKTAATLKAASVPRKRLIEDADAKVDAALGLFSRLRETLQRANTVQLRELLASTIDRVEVWSERADRKFQLQRGVIHLRGESFNNLFHSSYQVKQLLTIPFTVKRAA